MGGFSFEAYSRSYVDESSLISEIRNPYLLALIDQFNNWTKQEIYNLLANGERVTLEYKKAQSNLPSSLWETYSAFANTYGGTILLGVYEDMTEKDNSKRFTITGVEDAAKIKKDLWNTIHS